MSKNVKRLVVLFSVILGPVNLFATSGACSWHGGVSCIISQSVGHVVCKDGWEDSTVYYSQIDECSQSCDVFATSCNPASIEQQCKTLEGAYMMSQIVANTTGASWNQGTNQNTDCRNQLQICNQTIALYNSCMSAKAKAAQLELDDYKKKIQDKADAFCSKTSPFTRYDDTQKKCLCIDGYMDFKGACVTRNEAACFQSFGQFAKFENGNCGCQSGYVLDPADKCILDVKVSTSTPLNTSSQDQVQAKLSFSRLLKVGMSGDDVKQLQVLLKKMNYLPKTQVPSTYFGNITSSAVIKFQKDNKIQPANGVFGPMTQAKINSLAK